MHPIAPGMAHGLLSPQVVGVIGHHIEGVVSSEVVEQRAEQFTVAVAEVAHFDQPQGFLQFRQRSDHVTWAVAALFQGRDLFHGFAEQEEVLGTDKLPNLHIGPVKGADGEGAIHGELHVAGAGGFLAGGGDLFGQIRSGVDLLAQLHVVIRQEHHPQQAVHVGIGIDGVGNAVDEADDQLRHVVARSGLAAEDHGAGRHAIGLAVLDPQVLGDHLQGVEVLALVFVDALHLHVEQAGGIHEHTCIPVDVGGQLALHRQLGVAPELEEAVVVLPLLQLAQVLHVGDPVWSHVLIQQGRHLGVGQGDPAPRGDAIGDVGELLRP